MNRLMKIDDALYELYVMRMHSIFKKENISAEK